MIASLREVLDFWFKETDPKLWFATDAALDARIREKFEETWQAARAGKLDDWKANADGALALVLVLDQFPRNMFRGRAQAYSTDALAREVAISAIARKFDLEVPQSIRHFFYLPLMHSEALEDQERCLELVRERCGDKHLAYPYAVGHRDVIARFGRFPARNLALGRSSTPEELAFLARQTAS